MKIKAKPFAELDSAKQADGLIPAVIQDDRTLQVLMLGYMNREAYEKSLAEGRVTFYSRTRGCLWTKGETSGNYLDIVSVTADCDDDTLLIRVIPHGPTCHTGAKSCFAGAAPETEGFIRYLQSVIRSRHAEMPEGSYTSKLFDRGVNKIAQKVGEEAVEIFRRCGTAFPGLLVLGLALLITCQALLHIMVTVNLIPETGQTLPLISRGGSSVLFTTIALGMILSVSRQNDEQSHDTPKNESIYEK